MWRYFQKTDGYLCQHIPFLLLQCLLIVIRLPSLFEPYWYGDEGIYLTIGNGMRQGLRLYADVIDHKTPLIYYLAMTPSQLWFRVLMLVWMMIATLAFYKLAQKLFRSSLTVAWSTLFFVVSTNLPGFEGNIPNGELFVMGFILVGGGLLSTTSYWYRFFSSAPQPHSKADHLKLVGVGWLFGLGILTKVPGLFDAVAFLIIGWFSLTRSIELPYFKLKKLKPFVSTLKKTLTEESLLLIGIIMPIVLSVVYFTVRGSLPAYLDFGLLYNFRYAGSWQPTFSSPLIAASFTLGGKAVILASLLGILTLGRKLFSPQYQFLAGWFGLALFAALLSNRPYPHYFLQLMPPLSLLVGMLLESALQIGRHHWRKSVLPLAQTAVSFMLLALWLQVMTIIGLHRYPTINYYHRFIKLVTGQMDWVAYRQSFNNLMTDNYRAAQIIGHSNTQRIFIWGTNPILYAQSRTAPTGRFTVSFHIKDFKAQAETMNDVVKKQPTFIVVMHDEQDRLPGLNEYLATHYMPNDSFEHFTLWKRY